MAVSVSELQWPFKNKPKTDPHSEATQKIRVSYHVFPESSNGNGKSWERFNARLRPEVTKKTPAIKIPPFIKRGFDIAATLSRLVILSPVFLTNVLGIKLTSKRPVLSKQHLFEKMGFDTQRRTEQGVYELKMAFR